MREILKKNKWITLLASLGVVYFFLAFIAPLLTPILLAFLFVTMTGPLLKKLQNKFHIPRQVSAVVLLLFAVILVGAIVWLIISWAVNNAAGWSAYLDVWEKALGELIHNLCIWLGNTFSVDVSGLEESVSGISGNLLGKMEPDMLPELVDMTAKGAKKVVSGGAFFITFFIGMVLLAKDYDKYMNFLLEQKEFHVGLDALCGTVRYIVSFLKAQLIIMGTVATLIGVVLFAARIPNGILWGLLAGALDILPFVGTGIVLVPLVLIQLAQGMYGKAIVGGLLYVGCILLREFLEPKILGKTMGLWPVAVLTSIYVGIQLFGFAGVIKGPLGFVLVYQIYQSVMA